MTILLPRRSVRHRTDVAASDESINDDESVDDPNMPALVERNLKESDIEDDSDDEDDEMAATVGGDDVAVSPVAAKAAPQSECLSRPLFCFICDFD